jgi:DNA-binding transcriptional LysR family regulator
MNITIDQILCLKAVYSEGSLTKASEKLYRAKSAVNYSLNNLEEQLGFILLDKSGYRPKLTPKAEEFLFKSKNLLVEYDLLLKNSQMIQNGIEMRISISASSMCNLDQMYKVIKKAMIKYPSTEIILHREIMSGEKMLTRDEVDIAMFENITHTDNRDYKQLGKFELPLVIAGDHPFLKLKKKDQTRENLLKYPHIIQQSTIRDAEPIGIYEDESLRWEVTDILSKKELIQNGLGWGRLSDHMIQKELKSKKLVHLKNIDVKPKIKVYLCRKKSKVHGEVSNFIWDSFTKTI